MSRWLPRQASSVPEATTLEWPCWVSVHSPLSSQHQQLALGGGWVEVPASRHVALEPCENIGIGLPVFLVWCVCVSICSRKPSLYNECLLSIFS